jgi:4-alpha-glucanotransferase
MRRGGVLLHITSLPSNGPIGDLGPSARAFAHWLHDNGLSAWQILPLNPVGPGRSPYASPSAFALETDLISLDDLRDQGLLGNFTAPPARWQVQVDGVQSWKRPLLDQAADAWLERHGHTLAGLKSDWLDDWALFRALQGAHDGCGWWRWGKGLRTRHGATLARARKDLAHAIAREKALQCIAHDQLGALRRHCDALSIELIGDMPIFVSGDGCDTWVHTDQFQMDRDGNQAVQAGVPPDYFNPEGQHWGNPHYDWAAMAATDWSWWRRRVEHTLSGVHRVRLDHFRGFEACWTIPSGASPLQGRWVPGPGMDLLQHLAHLPIIAEDLGTITPGVERLLEQTGFPGMKILQFAFSTPDGSHAYLPHNYASPNCVVYTGTHDNDTTRGWYASASGALQHRYRVHTASNGHDVAWDLIRMAWSSTAQLAIAPMQDVLDLDTAHRMNVPGQGQGNWGWRMDAWPAPHVGPRMRQLTEAYGRLPPSA